MAKKISQFDQAATVVSRASNTALATLALNKGAGNGAIIKAAKGALASRIGTKGFASWANGPSPANAKDWSDFAAVAMGHAGLVDSNADTKKAVKAAARAAIDKARETIAAAISQSEGLEYDGVAIGDLHHRSDVAMFRTWATEWEELAKSAGPAHVRALKAVKGLIRASEVLDVMQAWADVDAARVAEASATVADTMGEAEAKASATVAEAEAEAEAA